MLKFEEILYLRKLVKEKKNIMSELRKKNNSNVNTIDAILYSYDLQSGSYVNAMLDPVNRKKREIIGAKLSQFLKELDGKTILEAGVGEATTLSEVIRRLGSQNSYLAFDISLSRLLFAKRYLSERRQKVELFCSELGSIPISSNSVDVVFTFHAVEPNHGREESIVSDLLRVCKNYLVLIEPSYELGSEKTRVHVEEHGYCRGLPSILEELGVTIVKHELWELDVNPHNQAAIIIAEKPRTAPTVSKAPHFISPISGKRLGYQHDCWFCEEDGYAYPVICGIPCLTKSAAILASKLGEIK